MKHLIFFSTCLFLTSPIVAQHMYEIRNELYPTFQVGQFEANLTEQEYDYEPQNPDKREVNPHVTDYEEAFEGYFVLHYFYKKRRRELEAKLDSIGREKLSREHDKWLSKVHKDCNKIWKADKNGYSQDVLRYMYCRSSKLKAKIVSMGGGFQKNSLLDNDPSFDRFTIGMPKSSIQNLIQLKDDSGVYHTVTDTLNIQGAIGELRLWFKDDKLSSLMLKFDCCGQRILDVINERFGGCSQKSTDPITMFRFYYWEGARAGLRADYYSESNLTLILSAL